MHLQWLPCVLASVLLSHLCQALSTGLGCLAGKPPFPAASEDLSGGTLSAPSLGGLCSAACELVVLCCALRAYLH